jgi:hypothetical protein
MVSSKEFWEAYRNSLPASNWFDLPITSFDTVHWMMTLTTVVIKHGNGKPAMGRWVDDFTV